MSAPGARARRVGQGELLAWASASDCVSDAQWLAEDRALVRVALPYLALDPDAPDEPERRSGFQLGVELPRGYPGEAPTVLFLAERPIYHPAVSPLFGLFCLGHAAWSPDLGLARFIGLHVEAVVGAVPVDTLDGIFRDPVCRRAATHYRALREKGELPLARPALAHGGRAAARAAHDSVSPPPGAEGVVIVRGPAGRRPVWWSEADGTGTTGVCPVAGHGWGGGLTPHGASALDWLARSLAEWDAAAALVDPRGTPTVTWTVDRIGPEARKALVERFAALLHLVEPVLALSDPDIASGVLDALHPLPHREES